jgi:hypothetical protein
MTARKAPAPVANLAQSRKEQAAMRQAAAEAKQRHPAGKQAPKAAAAKAPAAKPAAEKPAAAKVEKVEAEKVVYTATGRGGVVRRSTSTTVLSHAVDVKIAGRKAAQFAAGVIVQMYASEAAATKAAESVNAGAAGPDWTEAIIVPVEVA